MGKKLRDKDYRTGYEQGFKDAVNVAMMIVNKEFDLHNEKAKNEKEHSSR
jgi:hypothetical protein